MEITQFGNVVVSKKKLGNKIFNERENEGTALICD